MPKNFVIVDGEHNICACVSESAAQEFGRKGVSDLLHVVHESWMCSSDMTTAGARST